MHIFVQHYANMAKRTINTRINYDTKDMKIKEKLLELSKDGPTLQNLVHKAMKQTYPEIYKTK